MNGECTRTVWHFNNVCIEIYVEIWIDSLRTRSDVRVNWPGSLATTGARERGPGVAEEQCNLSRTCKFNADYSSRAHQTFGLWLSSSHGTLSKCGDARCGSPPSREPGTSPGTAPKPKNRAHGATYLGRRTTVRIQIQRHDEAHPREK